VVSQLMRNLRLSRFVVQGEGQRASIEIRYTSLQRRQLIAFACAAAAMLTDPNCVDFSVMSSLDADLVRLRQHSAAERGRTGDVNYVARRGALLHSDIAMFQPHAPVEPFSSSPMPSVGPTSWRIDIADGRGLDAGMSALHWDIARLALDQVRPPGSD